MRFLTSLALALTVAGCANPPAPNPATPSTPKPASAGSPVAVIVSADAAATPSEVIEEAAAE